MIQAKSRRENSITPTITKSNKGMTKANSTIACALVLPGDLILVRSILIRTSLARVLNNLAIILYCDNLVKIFDPISAKISSRIEISFA